MAGNHIDNIVIGDYMEGVPYLYPRHVWVDSRRSFEDDVDGGVGGKLEGRSDGRIRYPASMWAEVALIQVVKVVMQWLGDVSRLASPKCLHHNQHILRCLPPGRGEATAGGVLLVLQVDEARRSTFVLTHPGNGEDQNGCLSEVWLLCRV